MLQDRMRHTCYVAGQNEVACYVAGQNEVACYVAGQNEIACYVIALYLFQRMFHMHHHQNSRCKNTDHGCCIARNNQMQYTAV